jgi:hypothetical protein
MTASNEIFRHIYPGYASTGARNYSDGTIAPAMTYESDVKTMIAMLQRRWVALASNDNQCADRLAA